MGLIFSVICGFSKGRMKDSELFFTRLFLFYMNKENI